MLYVCNNICLSIYIYIERERCVYIYIYICIHTHDKFPCGPRARELIGWSNNNFNSLRFEIPLETTITTTFSSETQSH